MPINQDELIQDMAAMKMVIESFYEKKFANKDFSEEELTKARNSLVIIPLMKERTKVSAVAIAQNPKHNKLLNIKCDGGHAIGGYAYDMGKDCIILEGVDYCHLSHVPIAMQVTVPNTGNWKCVIPLSEEILEKYFNASQKKALRAFKEKYPEDKFKVHLIQFLGA